MKIGIISDSHDDMENVQESISIFNRNDVKYVIHAGDYIFPGIIKEFVKLKAKLIGVLGNNDGEINGISKSFKDINGELMGEIGEIEIDKIKFGIYHGTKMEIKENMIKSQKYDILICGHTHQQEPLYFGKIPPTTNSKTFVLNPGSSHRKSSSISKSFEDVGKIILLDTRSREYEFIHLSK